MYNGSGMINPWDPGYAPPDNRKQYDNEQSNADYDYPQSYRRSPSLDYNDGQSVDNDNYYDERDRRSPDYRPYRKERDRERERKDRGKDDREKGYRDREDRDGRRRDRDSVEKERDRDRDRARDRERERERERSRSRSRDRMRDRSRDRDRDRDRDRRRNRDRDRDRDRRGKRNDRSRDREDDRNRDLNYDHDQSRSYGSMDGVHYKNQTANNTIMIRGLAQHITETDIRAEILIHGLIPKDIRLIRNKDTGASRGFAFVEFNATEEATRWMEMKQGVLMLQDTYRALMQYSIPKDGDKQTAKNAQDWHCIKCGAHNFKRRESCFKCSAPRALSEEGGEGRDEICSYPTNIVILRGLDVLSTEDSVLQSLQSLSSQPIRSIRIGRDPLTNTSRGVCYLEMANVVDAMYLHTALTKQELQVDGKVVEIAYCKLHQTNSWNQSEKNPQYTLEDVAQLAEYSANLYATTPAQKAHYLQYYTQYYQNQISQGSAINLPSQNQTDRVNAAAAVAHTAIQQQLHKKMNDHDEMRAKSMPAAPMNTSLAIGRVPAHSNDGKVYALPDVSSYQYDETSGYYYDPSTGLYYDPTTQYYYNSHTQQFLFWDVESSSYKPAQHTGVGIQSDGTQPGVSGDPLDEKKKEAKQDKVKVAKKIAKDMERWAKTLNQKKEIAKSTTSTAEFSSAGSEINQIASGTADACFAIMEKKNLSSSVYLEDDDYSDNQRPIIPNYGPISGGQSESEEEIEDVQQEDRQHTDWGKLACLLCKRQFPNKEVLMKHQQLSDLHKQNLENWYRVRGLDPNDPQQRNNKYRDRAKERRAKYGDHEVPRMNKLKEKFLKSREEAAMSAPYEEPTKAGIGSDNVGNKLLQKMGWSAGMGLGKSNQGRTSIIEAERRVATAGLGSKTSSYNAMPGDTYKDCVKKLMIARYQELSD